MKIDKFFVKRINEDCFEDNIDPRFIYLIGDPLYIGIFKCPCGCGEDTHINFIKDTDCWDVVIDKNGFATITPSILRTIGCKSHFYIKHGLVI